MKIVNRRAHYDYDLFASFEAGIHLLGSEVKAIRLGQADLTSSFVRIRGSEAYLVNSKIFPYKYARPDAYDERRSRKLLLHKKEIITLKAKMAGAALTLVPVSLYTTRTLVKVEIALGKPKRKFNKKEAIKKRDLKRDVEATFKTRLD